ncbi:MAG: hypothetical protein ABIJ56_00885 [Pseudomonadota bacterium]
MGRRKKELPEPEPSDAPPENIGPGGSTMRYTMGAAMLVIGAIACAVMVFTGISRWWRLLLLLPLYNGFLGLLQANRRVCVAMAGQGFKKINGRPQKVRNPDLAMKIKKRAHMIILLSAVLAAALTALCLLIPARV